MANTLHKDVFSAIALSASYVIGLCFFSEPIWQSNDDVWWSMVAHGYGFVAEGTAKLWWSNVIWGYLVRAIPTVNGVLGYSTATFGSLIIFGAILVYAFRKMGFSWLVSISLLVLLLTRPVLSPQFTINAGLLTVGAVICTWLYRDQQQIGTLAVGCILAFLGYLVRDQEFFFIILVALPLLPWQTVLKDQSAKVAVLSLVLAIAGANYAHHLSYQGAEWDDFKNWTPVRVQLLDFGKLNLISGIADSELEEKGISQNDISMLAMTFDVGPTIGNPDLWRPFAENVGLNNSVRAWGAIGKNFGKMVFNDRRLGVLLVVSLILFLLKPKPGILVAYGLFFAAATTLAWLGRPPMFRVTLPAVTLLVIAPLLSQSFSIKSYTTHWFRGIIVVLILLTILNFRSALSRNYYELGRASVLRSEFLSMPEGTKFFWGGFGVEKIYPTLSMKASIMEIDYVWLSGAHNPAFDNSEKLGAYLIFRRLFISEDGALIVHQKGKPYQKLLGAYCAERLNGSLEVLEHWEGQQLAWMKVSCR
jgi:hypothetical protein